jgi:hypothetical protein
MVALSFVVDLTSDADGSLAWPLAGFILYGLYMIPLMFGYIIKSGLAHVFRHHLDFVLGSEYDRFLDSLSLDEDYNMDDAARNDAWMAGEHSIFMSARLRICLPSNWDLVAALIVMLVAMWLFSTLG